MWPELPDWATITRSSPEVVFDEVVDDPNPNPNPNPNPSPNPSPNPNQDLFQLEWAKRVQPHRPSPDLRDREAGGQASHVGASLRASRGGGIDDRSPAELEHHAEL